MFKFNKRLLMFKLRGNIDYVLRLSYFNNTQFILQIYAFNKDPITVYT